MLTTAQCTMLLLLLSLHVGAFSLFPFLVRHPNRTVCGDSSLSYNQYPCYPQPYPWTRAGVGQSPQDAGSQTCGVLSLSFHPLLLFVYILPRVFLTLTRPSPLLPSPGCSPSFGGVLIAHSFIADIDDRFFLYTAPFAYDAYNILAVGSYSR